MSETSTAPVSEAPAATQAADAASAPAAAPAAPAEATSLLGEAKPGETPAEAKADEAKAPEHVVPEVYDLKLPDGATLDADLHGAYTGALKEAGLSQAQAEKLTPFLAAKLAEIRTDASRAWASLQSDWVSTIKADADIGGAKLSGALSDAGAAIDRFGGADLRRALNITGAGNNPTVVKAFAAIGKALGNTTSFPTGGKPAARDNSMSGLASRLYGSK